MIVYFATRGFDFTVTEYFQTWSRSLLDRLEVILYEDLPERRTLPAGTYVFADVERLDADHRRLAEMLWSQVSQSAPRERLLNHPAETLRRYDLLRTLADRGMNRFRVERLPETLAAPRSPVFLRHEVHHLGPLSELMTTQEELERAVSRAAWLGYDPAQLLLVEFCDTSDEDHLFRKYSAFVVGDRIVPREVSFSRHWELQDVDLLDAELIAEEHHYLMHNPHAERLREIARLAKVGYGRFDYALRDGEIQVWEINTNPIVMRAPGEYRQEHLPNQRLSAERLGEAFEELDHESSGPEIEIRLPKPRTRQARRTREFRERMAMAAYWWSKGWAGPLVRMGEAVAVPLRRPLLWLVRRRLRRERAVPVR